MGRITNVIGIRLGNKISWINSGIYIKKIKCIKYINFINNIVNLVSIGKVQKKDYLLSKIILLQEKLQLIVNIYFYRKYIKLSSIKKIKISNKIKKINKFLRKKKKLKKFKLLKKRLRKSKKIKKFKLLKKSNKSKKVKKNKKLKKIKFFKRTKNIKKFKKIKFFRRKKFIIKKKNFKYYKKKRIFKLKYIIKKKLKKYFFKNRLFKFKISKKLKKNIYIYNNIFSNNLKKRKLLNFNFIIIFKKNINNILYNYIKKKLKIFKKYNKKIYKRKKLKKIIKLLDKNINKSKKIKRLKKLILKSIINYNNKIDLIKINKIIVYKNLNNYFIQSRLFLFKKKLSLLYLRKKKKNIKINKIFNFT